MSAAYLQPVDLSLGVWLWVEFTTHRGRVVDYAIVVMLSLDDSIEVIRVYDGAHGYNEMHRYSRLSGKRSGTVFHSGSLSEGMNAAMVEARKNYRAMIEGWRT